jgi:Uma2 family endonuclease
MKDRDAKALLETEVSSGEELARMPRRGPCELVRGRIVRASPTAPEHARVAASFCFALRSFVKPRGLGEVLVGEVGVTTGRNPDTIRGADVAFISTERYETCRGKRGFLETAPELVVEILSPGDTPKEVDEKVSEYLASGVLLVWVVDPARRTVRSFRKGGEPPGANLRVLAETDLLSGDDVLPGFSSTVGALIDG